MNKAYRYWYTYEIRSIASIAMPQVGCHIWHKVQHDTRGIIENLTDTHLLLLREFLIESDAPNEPS